MMVLNSGVCGVQTAFPGRTGHHGNYVQWGLEGWPGYSVHLFILREKGELFL